MAKQSEQLLEFKPEPIGKYVYYRTPNVTIGQLLEHGILRHKNFTGNKSKRFDGILMLNKTVKALVELKTPDKLNTKKKQMNAIEQEINEAKEFADLLIVTDNTTNTFWYNTHTHNSLYLIAMVTNSKLSFIPC